MSYKKISEKLQLGIQNSENIPDSIISFVNYLSSVMSQEDDEDDFDFITPQKFVLLIDNCRYCIKTRNFHFPVKISPPMELYEKRNEIFENFHYIPLIVEAGFDKQFSKNFRDCFYAAYECNY